MDFTSWLPNGTVTTDSAGISNPAGKTFTAGYATSSNDMIPLTITSTQFTELEHSFRSTSNVTIGTTYCFRVTNAGSETYFTYSQTPSVSVQPISNRPTGGGGNVGGEGSGSGSQQSGGGSGGGTPLEGSGSGGVAGGGTPGGGDGGLE